MACVAWVHATDFERVTSVTSKSTELEVMVGFADADDQRESKASPDEIVEPFRLSGPACAPYIEEVASLARRIGGGRGARCPAALL